MTIGMNGGSSSKMDFGDRSAASSAHGGGGSGGGGHHSGSHHSNAPTTMSVGELPKRERFNWFFTKVELRNTPSIQKGLTFEHELQYREDGARLICRVGNQMNLHYSTIATGIVYYHRFYMIHTFQNFPRYVTAAACLFLAGKVEETPKKGKDIVRIFKENLSPRQALSFGDDGKEEILIIEKVLLQTINFDMDVEHPYGYLVIYSKIFNNVYDKELLQNIVQMAWTFTNDSFYTFVCLQWEPEIIAIAMLYLSFKINKIYRVFKWDGRKPIHRNWWDMFVQNLTVAQIEDVCHTILDYYSKVQDASAGVGPSPILTTPPESPAKMPFNVRNSLGQPPQGAGGVGGGIVPSKAGFSGAPLAPSNHRIPPPPPPPSAHNRPAPPPPPPSIAGPSTSSTSNVRFSLLGPSSSKMPPTIVPPNVQANHQNPVRIPWNNSSTTGPLNSMAPRGRFGY